MSAVPGSIPVDDILALAGSLIRIPSQGGIDAPAAVLDHAARAMAAAGLQPRLLDAGGAPVALMAEIRGGRPGPAWVLNACIDTAPIGDRGAWSLDPFAGLVKDGWLWGRGAADSKIAVASFIRLGAALQRQAASMAGSVILLFDADEHTGRFGGIKRFIAERPDVAGVMVGYPENDGVNIGARGFWRAVITVHGTAQHSGFDTPPPSNAAVKLAALIQRLANAPLPQTGAGDPFPLSPKLTVTAVSGGGGFSVVPNAASLHVDIRLTPGFGPEAAAALIAQEVASLDKALPAERDSRIEPQDHWGAYRLEPDNVLAAAVIAGAGLAAGRAVPGIVCGPSNIGNYLADRGIAATCGFGVTCQGVHGADERAEIATLPLVWNTYAAAIARLTA